MEGGRGRVIEGGMMTGMVLGSWGGMVGWLYWMLGNRLMWRLWVEGERLRVVVGRRFR